MKQEENIDERLSSIQDIPAGNETEEEYENLSADNDAQTDDAQEDDINNERTRPTLKEVIEENAREDEKPFSSRLTLRTILGGDILNTQAIRRQVWLILLITVFAILSSAGFN